MINLKKEIEKLRTTNKPIYVPYTDGKNEGINECLKILNQYNIITAPKSIKLSELIEKLDKEYNPRYFFKYDKKFKCIQSWCFIWNKKDVMCQDAVIWFKNNKIMELNLKEKYDYPKWLYTLWIAGTEIIDDLKELEG